MEVPVSESEIAATANNDRPCLPNEIEVEFSTLTVESPDECKEDPPVKEAILTTADEKVMETLIEQRRSLVNQCLEEGNEQQEENENSCEKNWDDKATEVKPYDSKPDSNLEQFPAPPCVHHPLPSQDDPAPAALQGQYRKDEILAIRNFGKKMHAVPYLLPDGFENLITKGPFSKSKHVTDDLSTILDGGPERFAAEFLRLPGMWAELRKSEDPDLLKLVDEFMKDCVTAVDKTGPFPFCESPALPAKNKPQNQFTQRKIDLSSQTPALPKWKRGLFATNKDHLTNKGKVPPEPNILDSGVHGRFHPDPNSRHRNKTFGQGPIQAEPAESSPSWKGGHSMFGENFPKKRSSFQTFTGQIPPFAKIASGFRKPASAPSVNHFEMPKWKPGLFATNKDHRTNKCKVPPEPNHLESGAYNRFHPDPNFRYRNKHFGQGPIQAEPAESSPSWKGGHSVYDENFPKKRSSFQTSTGQIKPFAKHAQEASGFRKPAFVPSVNHFEMAGRGNDVGCFNSNPSRLLREAAPLKMQPGLAGHEDPFQSKPPGLSQTPVSTFESEYLPPIISQGVSAPLRDVNSVSSEFYPIANSASTNSTWTPSWSIVNWPGRINQESANQFNKKASPGNAVFLPYTGGIARCRPVIGQRIAAVKLHFSPSPRMSWTVGEQTRRAPQKNTEELKKSSPGNAVFLPYTGGIARCSPVIAQRIAAVKLHFSPSPRMSWTVGEQTRRAPEKNTEELKNQD